MESEDKAAALKIGDVRRKIGPLEIRRKIDAEQACATAGNIGVAGKIKINLKREGDHSDPSRSHGTRAKLLGEISIRDDAEAISEDGLLDQSLDDLNCSPPQIPGGWLPTVSNLRRTGGANDRPSN